MATYYEEIPQGIVIWCVGCKGPIREVVYHHQCDIRITPDRTYPNYCFSCMAERKVCRRCKDDYSEMFSSVSLRTTEEMLRHIRAIVPRVIRVARVARVVPPPHLEQILEKKRIPLVERAVVTTSQRTIDIPKELQNPQTQHEKARSNFYRMLAEYSTIV